MLQGTIEVVSPPRKGRVEVVIPGRPRVHHDGASQDQITVDEALQFTPMTTSVLPAHGMFRFRDKTKPLTIFSDRIPIPQLRHAQNQRLASTAERQAVYGNEYNNSKVKDRLAMLLDPNRLSER
jgi:hypothetical protein